MNKNLDVTDEFYNSVNDTVNNKIMVQSKNKCIAVDTESRINFWSYMGLH